ncbi:MAG TPA: hypothetical protein VN276_02990, partial [Bacteroidales bacterium]|nr:hypothetical protein [Bacteroidales bacterium]
DQHLEDIKVIKKIMEESSRFLSLSGLSGIVAGLLAIAGAVAANLIINGAPAAEEWYSVPLTADPAWHRSTVLLFADMAAVLVLSLAAAVLFSSRKARKSGLSAWTPVTRRMLASLLLPLVTGGLFIFITLSRVPANVTIASTLIFYGLAVISAGKFTFGEIHRLGVLEVLTGLVCLLVPQWSVFIWALGFGVIHIGYGLFMHLRYKG